MDDARTILVPIDFSEASLAALGSALSLHAEHGSTVVVQHVLDSEHVEFAVELGYAMRGEVEAKARIHAERAMQRLTDLRAPEGVDVQRVVSVGRPVLEILRLASELAADLIVLGSHPPSSSPERALFGSTAERVLRAARCPVLVLPGPAGGAELTAPEEDLPSGAPSTT